MRRFVFCLLAGLVGCAPRPGAAPTPAAPPVVLLISIDGFRADYLELGVTPVLDSLARNGTRAAWLEPSFPTKTFPNHYTLVTGLRPDRHGIIANNITDSTLGRFTMSTRAAVRDPRWWGGEPIWVTAERAGRPTAPLFWPGSEAPIGGVWATHWLPFDDGLRPAVRIDSLMSWLDVPAARRPAFASLYLSGVDHAGHDFGPDSRELRDSLAAADAVIGELIGALDRHGLAGVVNLIVVSDHGMAPVGPERVIVLDELIRMDDVTIADWGPAVMIAPKPGREEAVYRSLRGAHPALDVYRKADLPARLGFGSHPRIPAIVAIAADGWTVTTRDRVARVRRGGNHGFDNQAASMRALFIAGGPAFRRGAVVPPFSNVHVYELMAHILGLVPAPNQGSLDSVRAVLR